MQTGTLSLCSSLDHPSLIFNSPAVPWLPLVLAYLLFYKLLSLPEPFFFGHSFLGSVKFIQTDSAFCSVNRNITNIQSPCRSAFLTDHSSNPNKYIHQHAAACHIKSHIQLHHVTIMSHHITMICSDAKWRKAINSNIWGAKFCVAKCLHNFNQTLMIKISFWIMTIRKSN